MAAAQKVQLLADALALEFSQSLASAQCSSALRQLLPGLKYLSIAVSNPAQGGSFVASSNCAAEGPTTLHLHDPLTSAAGLALARTQPISVSLLNATSAKVVPALTDVQQMVLHAPTVTHLLCIPFGCGTSNSRDLDGVCHRHSSLGGGSGTGALLFGFSDLHAVDERRMAVLGLLAQCLPDPMARLSADTLQFVNFACGSGSQCTCCCPQGGEEEQEEEEEEAKPSSPCSHDGRGDRSGDGGGGAPSQALLRPPGLVAGTSKAPYSRDDAACSSQGLKSDEFFDGKSRKATGAATAAAPAPPSSLQPPSSPERQQRFPAARRQEHHFSKALVTSVAEGGERCLSQAPLTLSFRAAAVEEEYARWIAQYYIKVDTLFSLLLIAALAIVTVVRPYRLIDNAPVSIVLGGGMALPLLLIWWKRAMYTRWREQLVLLLRLYVVAFINLVSIRSYQGHLPTDRVKQWVTYWMLTGAESLSVTAVGFPIRMSLHLPLQFAAMGLAASNLPRMCSDCYAGVDSSACIKRSAAMAAVFGAVLPTLGLRYIEKRSRGLFANILRRAAAHEA